LNDSPYILYFVRNLRDAVHDAALAGVRRYASARGWDVKVFHWEDVLADDFPSIWVSQSRPLGCVVECGDLPADLPLGAYGDAPAVFLNYSRAPRGRRFARIVLDDDAVARTAFRELAASHPAAFGVVGFGLGPRHWSDMRVKAFRAAVAEAGLECREFAFADSRQDDVSVDPARLAAWLSALPRHTAVFVVNDDTAILVAEAALKTGRNIPRDFTLIGADNDPKHCEKTHPTLSSIQLDFESAGFQSAKLLDEMIVKRTYGGGGHVAASIGPLMTVRRESTMGHGRREARILEAVEIIRREACDGLTAEALAARFPGSRRLFELRFREAMGRSILDEILHVRMQKVMTLLADMDIPIGAIADFCGFRSDRALRKLFLAREGMSMAAWRRLHHR
jgi:LacI family transcriptional regulator